MNSVPPVIFLMGPTACGKTALSLQVAETIDAEIVSVDSALVYRGMDIGTAKPSAEERARVPHHLIDIRAPHESYSAAAFCEDALCCIDDIRQRGRRVLLVGGTMLYFKALEEGLADLPDADPAIRRELAEQAELEGWPALHALLKQIDPASASRIHPNDPQRLQRALEVYRLRGVPLSQLQKDTRPLLDQAPVKLALIPEDRQWLHRRIADRFEQMVSAGFLQEVQRLRHDPANDAAQPSMRSVGYRQAWEHLALCRHDSESASAGDMAWVPRAIAATRQLAKRQLTWLRGMRDLTPVACDRLTLAEQQQIILDTLA